MRSAAEQAATERFARSYLRGQSPTMRAIERRVCGCDYGATSWTSLDQSERLAALLGLRPGRHLLELGAGSGWPGLQLAKASGCAVTLVDLPLEGLRIAAARARREGIEKRCRFAVADGAQLPFAEASFDAVGHSDLLCCLLPKRAVLAACRRVIRTGGRMVFSVIFVAPGLAPAAYRRAVENGPEFIETASDYPTLLAETGWDLVQRIDVGADYGAACRRQLAADEAHQGALEALLGAADLAERLAGWRANLEVIDDGHLRREIFVAAPAP